MSKIRIVTTYDFKFLHPSTAEIIGKIVANNRGSLYHYTVGIMPFVGDDDTTIIGNLNRIIILTGTKMCFLDFYDCIKYINPENKLFMFSGMMPIIEPSGIMYIVCDVIFESLANKTLLIMDEKILQTLERKETIDVKTNIIDAGEYSTGYKKLNNTLLSMFSDDKTSQI